MDNWLRDVAEEEGRHEGEEEPHPIARQAHIQHAIALETTQTFPELLVCGLLRERILFASQTGDV